jgi:ribosome recycling factor
MKLSQLAEKADRQINILREDLATIRSGRASASLVENIKVEAYEGAPSLQLKELATISVPESTVIAVKPWDLTLIPKIEKAIRSAPGGLNPSVFDDFLRINLPPQSSERRLELSKVAKTKAEAAKIELRQLRQDEMKSIDEMEENGVISEDDRFRTREEVEGLIRGKTIEIDAIVRAKEKELLSI